MSSLLKFQFRLLSVISLPLLICIHDDGAMAETSDWPPNRIYRVSDVLTLSSEAAVRGNVIENDTPPVGAKFQFVVNRSAALKIGDFTAAHVGKRMGLVIGGHLVSDGTRITEPILSPIQYVTGDKSEMESFAKAWERGVEDGRTDCLVMFIVEDSLALPTEKATVIDGPYGGVDMTLPKATVAALGRIEADKPGRWLVGQYGRLGSPLITVELVEYGLAMENLAPWDHAAWVSGRKVTPRDAAH